MTFLESALSTSIGAFVGFIGALFIFFFVSAKRTTSFPRLRGVS